MTDRVDWFDRPLDQLRYTREVRRDRDEARHLRLVDERATVARLYPPLGLVDAAPVEPPADVLRALDLERATRDRARLRWLDEHTDPDDAFAETPPIPPDLAA